MKPTSVQEVLGQVIREERNSRGFSQERFATVVGLHRTYIGSLERGERNVSLRNLVLIANALGTRLSVLLEKTEARVQKAGRRERL